jgi:hypothetical protein
VGVYSYALSCQTVNAAASRYREAPELGEADGSPRASRAGRGKRWRRLTGGEILFAYDY